MQENPNSQWAGQRTGHGMPLLARECGCSTINPPSKAPPPQTVHQRHPAVISVSSTYAISHVRVCSIVHSASGESETVSRVPTPLLCDISARWYNPAVHHCRQMADAVANEVSRNLQDHSCLHPPLRWQQVALRRSLLRSAPGGERYSCHTARGEGARILQRDAGHLAHRLDRRRG